MTAGKKPGPTTAYVAAWGRDQAPWSHTRPRAMTAPPSHQGRVAGDPPPPGGAAGGRVSPAPVTGGSPTSMRGAVYLTRPTSLSTAAIRTFSSFRNPLNASPER